MKVLFAGGGTGGHLFSGIAVAQVMLDLIPENIDILFVGTVRGLEKELVPKYGFRLEFLPVQPLKGRGFFQKIKNIFQLPRSFWQSYQFIKREKPDFVFGIGGYASGPVTLLARLCGIRTAIIEQNSRPGFTNKILGKFVDRVFIAFEKARTFFPAKKTVLSGNPIRKSFIEESRGSIADPDALPLKKKFTLLILGGSQGAQAINHVFIEAASLLAPLKENFKIIHQTGKGGDATLVKDAYVKVGIEAEVIEFVDSIHNYYREADLVVARAGAGTLTELQLMGKPSVLIPYPYAADDHQRINGLEMVENGAAEMILQTELTADKICYAICSLMDQPERLQKMSQASSRMAKPDAAKEIADFIQRA